jgi:hypothetical protein
MILVDKPLISEVILSHSRWHRLKHCMDIDAVHRSIGLSQERRLFLVLISSMRLKQRSIVFKRISKP